MKHMQKLTCLMLALLMVLSLGITVFAAEGDPAEPEADPDLQELGKGTITVQSVKAGETYNLYLIATLEGYDKKKGNYSYKATNDFLNILKNDPTIKELLEVSDDGYITWKNPSNVSNAEGAKLAKPLAKFIKDQKTAGTPITAVKTANATNTDDIVWDQLTAGYYLVDTTTGSLCALDTTDMTATVQDKNIKPTNDKTATEDGRDQSWNDGGIGRSVNFKSSIKVYPGVENFIFHDKMSAGLTFDGVASVTVDVKVPIVGENTETLADTPEDPLKKYSVVKDPTCEQNCTFHVEFSQEFCDAITIPETVITITYSATVNENAVVAETKLKPDGTPDYDAMAGNSNEAKVSYGEDGEFSTGGTTKTFTYEVPIMKYTGSKDTPTALAGAQFELYGLEDKSYPIYFKDVGIVDGVQVYKRIEYKPGDPKPANAATLITPESGKILLKGLDAVPYYLFETVPPAGYNLMTGHTVINVNHGGLIQQNVEQTNTIMVLNNTGNRLPTTGGIGTTIFYVVGSIMLVGAGVLLITKKRMSAEG